MASTHLSQSDTTRTSAQAQRLLVRGLTHAYLDEYEQAIQVYQRALELAPQEATILSALADARAALDELDTATYYAQQAHQVAPDNPHYTLQLATLYERAERTDDAIRLYRALINTAPQSAEAYQSLAQLLIRDGQSQAAIDVYQQMVDHLGASPRTYVDMLRLYRRLNDTDGMRRTLERLVKLQPNAPYFRHQLADLYRKQDRLEQAAEVYRHTLETNPNDVSAALQLAEIYREQGHSTKADSLLDRTLQAEATSADQLVQRARPLYRRAGSDSTATQSAIQLLQRALEMDSQNEAALRMLGTLQYHNGAYQEAGPLLIRALDQNPRSPERWTQAASAFLRAEKAERAAEVAEEGLLLFPGQLPLVRISAYALMETNQNAQAIDRFKEALQLLDEGNSADQRAQFLAALGLLYSRQDNVAASDRYYQQAVETDSDLTLALNNYAYSLAERGTKLDRALELARRAVDLEPQNASFLDTLGWVHYQRGSYDEAKRWLTKAVNTGGASATVYEHLGDAYDALGQSDEARTYWQKALDRAPNRPALRRKLETASQDEPN